MPINFFYTGTCNKTEFSYVKQLSIYVEREATVEWTNLFFNAIMKRIFLDHACISLLILIIYLSMQQITHTVIQIKFTVSTLLRHFWDRYFFFFFFNRSPGSHEFTLQQYLNRQKHILHGYEARKLKHVPKASLNISIKVPTL